MPASKKDSFANMAGRQNGNRSSFQTDTAISSGKFGSERALQRWVPDDSIPVNESLESSTSNKPWDQFAENERRFGLTTDYHENIYTTTINKNHPQYRERMAAAERKVREIERSAPSTSHVAEERVMDFTAGADNGGDEEDKYSGVRRQDFPPLGGRENKYMPPAKRAPAPHSTVKGVPVDPAIISSQLKAPGSSSKKSTPGPDSGRNGVLSAANASGAARAARAAEVLKSVVPTAVVAPIPDQPNEANVPAPANDVEAVAKGVVVPTSTRSSVATNSRTTSTQVNKPPQAHENSATFNVEGAVLREFKNFASHQREVAQMARSNKLRVDKEVKLTELKKFANSFKLSTPVPTDLVSIIAKDPAKQKEIQAKAIKNAEEVAKSKVDATLRDKPVVKDPQPKTGEQSTTRAAPDTRAPRAPNTPQVPVQPGAHNRHSLHRQQFVQQPYQQYRNNRNGGPSQHGSRQQAGNMVQGLRNGEQQKLAHSANSSLQHAPAPGHDSRAPPTGPANNVDANFNRRPSGVPPHMGAKLNPNSHEFRPSAFAAPFNPSNQAAAITASPRTSANNISGQIPAAPLSPPAPLIRRKTKAVDPAKCNIMAHIKTLTPPAGRNWADNGGIRPSYDTHPSWRQLDDNEKPESTMHLTYKEHMERNPFQSPAMSTPNPTNAVPHMAHQHQLPFSLQGGHNMGPRQSPHMTQLHMHNHGPGPGPQPPYGHDDHRMVHSNSSQSFASPRLNQVPMAYSGITPQAHMQYTQSVFIPPGAPQMGQYRSFSNNPGYMPPQQGQMGAHIMMQPHFMPGPQGMPQMMYPGAHPQFMPPSGPPQGANGYPSPGRAQAPIMAQQGSQQGQAMYGMSPGVQYTQPSYGHGQPGGPVSNQRSYSNAGQSHFPAGPHQGHHQHGGHSQQRSGSNSGYNRGHATSNQNQSQSQSHNQSQQSRQVNQPSTTTPQSQEGP